MEMSMMLLCNMLMLLTFNCLVTNVLMMSIFWLMSVYVNSIIMLFLLNMQLMGAILLMVYVGAMAMMFMFSIMMINFMKISDGLLSQYGVMLMFIISLFISIKVNNWSNFQNIIMEGYNTNNLLLINSLSLWLYEMSSMYMMMSSLSLLLPMMGVLNYK